MKPLFNIEEIELAKSNKKFPFECEYCLQTFYTPVKFIKDNIKNKRGKIRFCNQKCFMEYTKQTNRINTKCKQCNKEIIITKCQQRQSKSGNSFCSKSCAAIYNNTHKKTGTKRSKLEAWIEKELISFYPNLEILFNDKTTINSELDIYFPSLKLAVELNGIFHYEPIYGKEKLASIQNNDNRKFQACLEREIELIIIDCSGLKHFKEKNAQKYLDIIVSIITHKNNNQEKNDSGMVSFCLSK